MIKLITVAELESILCPQAGRCITDAEIRKLRSEYSQNLNDYNIDFKSLMNSMSGSSFESSEEAINNAVNQLVISRVLCWMENNEVEFVG